MDMRNHTDLNQVGNRPERNRYLVFRNENGQIDHVEDIEDLAVDKMKSFNEIAEHLNSGCRASIDEFENFEREIDIERRNGS